MPKTKSTNAEFAAFCRAALQLPTVYMWGEYGRPLTAVTLAAKADQYPRHYPAERVAALKNRIGQARGCDCSGLIKWFLWSGGDLSAAPKYDADSDLPASGWYAGAAVRGAISDLPDTPGLILWMNGHCGVSLGGGEVIECTLSKFGDGVVRTALSDRNWEKWCECAFIDYGEDKADAGAEVEALRSVNARLAARLEELKASNAELAEIIVRLAESIA